MQKKIQKKIINAFFFLGSATDTHQATLTETVVGFISAPHSVEHGHHPDLLPSVALYCAQTNKAEMAFKEKQTPQRLLMRAAAQPDTLLSLDHPSLPQH